MTVMRLTEGVIGNHMRKFGMKRMSELVTLNDEEKEKGKVHVDRDGRQKTINENEGK